MKIVKNNNFNRNEECYWQVKIIINEFQWKAFGTAIKKPRVWLRYIEDLFAIWQEEIYDSRTYNIGT